MDPIKLGDGVGVCCQHPLLFVQDINKVDGGVAGARIIESIICTVYHSRITSSMESTGAGKAQ